MAWSVGSFLLPGVKVLEVDVRVHADPHSDDSRLRSPHVVVSSDDPLDAFLTPAVADVAADGLIALGLAVREQARLARRAGGAVAGV
ncbi:hypothetical protein CP982_07590 [Streptomyces spectabilis]|uniref:Uncharacterized protein n=1 Tax=Streptomyces spectabilis TaxID=68270 RepID=A0A5P2X640_STRST|nr:hypothetical protein CP982_07590 [Streptomyces spectabilis]